MSLRTILQGVMLLVVPFLMDGCTPTGGGRAAVGELGIAGPNVFVNGNAARTGTRIFSGDAVTTGPGSSAMILFATGGFFQLDENTDPIFSWETFASVRCVVVRIFRGQGYVDDSQACISSPAADALAHSAVNIAASASASVLTLLQGTLFLERPQRITLVPGQEVTADVGVRTVKVRALSQTELLERVAWRSRFRFQGWCNAAGGVRPAWLGECPGRFSFAQPQPPPSLQLQRSPFVPFGPIGPRVPTGRPSSETRERGSTRPE
jgi:hypothetical protein